MSLERRTPLKRSPMKRTDGQLARNPIKKKARGERSTELDFSDEVKGQVDRRAGLRCEFPGCSRVLTEYHHRKLRKHGGPGTVENCMGLCCAHHRYVHANPAEAYAAGWLIHAWGA